MLLGSVHAPRFPRWKLFAWLEEYLLLALMLLGSLGECARLCLTVTLTCPWAL